MTFRLYLHQARRWILLAVLPAAIVGSLAYLYTHHQPKVYQASATLYVEVATSSTSGAPGGTDIGSSISLVPTYAQMITEPVIESAVDRAMAHSYPGYRVEDHGVKVSQPAALQDTQLITVGVTDTIPVRAAAAATSMVNAFKQHVAQIESARFAPDKRSLQKQIDAAKAQIAATQAQIDHAGGADVTTLRDTLATYVNNYQTLLATQQEFTVRSDVLKNAVSVASPAMVPTTPIGPQPVRMALLGALASLVFFAAIIYIYDYLDDSLKTPQDVEELIQVPVLGTVGRFSPQRLGSQLIAQKEPRSAASEAYRMIRTNLQFADIDNRKRTIIVTSTKPQEGKSTTAANLAYVLAESGRDVVLVDADLRRPSQHQIFNVDRLHGLTNAVLGGLQPNGHNSDHAVLPRLAVVSSGPLPPRPADLLSSAHMRAYLASLEQGSDMVIIDSPPILAAADANILAAMSDGVILVVDLSRTTRRDLQRSRDAINAVGGKILGVVVNRLSDRAAQYYYGYKYEATASQPAEFVTPDDTAELTKVRSGFFRRQRAKS